MVGLWTNNGKGWDLLSPQAFLDEASLHRLIHDHPNLLPVAGTQRILVLGSEVQLGNGFADILAVEPSGRPTIIEVKLAKSREARRDIVSQVLSYAAFLRGMSIEALERGPLHRSLTDTKRGSILESVLEQDQEGAVDSATFTSSMQEYLDQGAFRLVLVLDEVSTELERVVAYLDAITVHALTIDLITLSLYKINDTQIALPQRITPDLGVALQAASPQSTKTAASRGSLTDGSGTFRASITNTAGKARQIFEAMIAWAEEIAELPNVRLSTFSGIEGRRFTLLPKVMPDNSGLITIWNDQQLPSIAVWRSVFERLAPRSIASVEQAIGFEIGQGNIVKDITPEVLEALKKAYEEAAGN